MKYVITADIHAEQPLDDEDSGAWAKKTEGERAESIAEVTGDIAELIRDRVTFEGGEVTVNVRVEEVTEDTTDEIR